MRVPVPRRRAPVDRHRAVGRDPSSSASVPAACSPRCCWRRWDSADRARARQGGARAHEGHLGPVAARRPRPGIERAVRRGRRRHVFRRQAVEPDQRPAPPDAQGARPSSSKPARPRRSSTSPSRTSAPSGWSAWSRRCAPRSSALGGEVRFGAARRRPARSRRGRIRGLVVAQADGDRQEIDADARRAGARPQRPRHLRDAARARRGNAGQAVLDRLSHRAPAGADRPCPLRRRTPATRCSAPPTTSWCTTRRTAARSTASACARAARWSPRRRSRAASSRTA